MLEKTLAGGDSYAVSRRLVPQYPICTLQLTNPFGADDALVFKGARELVGESATIRIQVQPFWNYSREEEEGGVGGCRQFTEC